MLISPWVPKGSVFQRPTGPTPTSEFELTSIPATVKRLFNLSVFLTARDAWAGSFDELLQTTRPRDDTPIHLPDAPLPSRPWDPPPQKDIGSPSEMPRTLILDRFDAVNSRPQHCSSIHGGEREMECAGPGVANLKQQRSIRLLASLTDTLQPNIEELSVTEADAWILRAWRRYMLQY